MLHQIVRNTLGHSGYELYPARRDGRPLLDFMTTTTHHDLHHAQAGWNYGLYFTWWDRLMGTEHPDYYARFAAASGARRIARLGPAAAGVAAALAIAALSPALAPPAAAQEIRVPVAGKDPATVRQEIRRSVEAVCKSVDREHGFLGAYTVQDCLRNSEADAMAQYRAYQLRAGGAEGEARTAELDRPSRPR
jgi:hypothetical protein